jgi:hypothetical protein
MAYSDSEKPQTEQNDAEESAATSNVPREPQALLDLANIRVADMAEDYRAKMGKLLDLSDKDRKKIIKRLKKEIDSWKEATAELHQRLEEDNDLVEGVIEEDEYPWDGASNIHVPVTGTYMKIFHSILRRSILGADVIWYAESMEQEDPDILIQTEEMMNAKSRDEWNIADCISGVCWTTPRDSVGVMQVVWAEDYEPAKDVLIITNVQEFLAQFPDPETAGLDPATFTALAQQIASMASEEAPLEIPITFQRQTYIGPKGYVINLADFLIFPAHCDDIRNPECRGYGKRYTTRRGVIKKHKADSDWYPEAVDRILKKTKKLESTSYTKAQDQIEGLSRANAEDEFQFFELVIKMELDPEVGEQKFQFTFNYECEELVQAIEYVYRVDNYALFHIERRPGRLLGTSIPRQTRSLNWEIDTQHNQRINSRTVSTVPSFKAKRGSNKDFDPEADENRWRPGVIFWLDEPEAFDQFKVQPTDLGESLQEEANDMKMLDLYLGSSAALLSGQVAPGDPTAPGNKTQMMIGQANLRMDDPLAEMREGVEMVGEICKSHIYQFGPPMIDYQVEGPDGRGVTKTLHKKFLRSGLKMRMAAVTVAHNPDTELQRGFMLYQNLVQDPIVAQDDQIRYEILRRVLRQGRVAGREQMLPPLEVVQMRQIQMQKTALMQAMVEMKQGSADQADQEKSARVGAAKENLNMKKTAMDTATAGLGLNGKAKKK